MKLIISGVVLLALTFSSCEQINEPVTNSTELNTQYYSSLEKASEDFNFSIIPLPEKSSIYLDSIFTVKKLINGLLGGTITLDKSYISKEGKLVTMLVDLVIPPLAFLGQREITVTIEDTIAVMNCGPSMNFQRSLLLVQTFTGLNLNNYNVKEIDFGYIGENGNFYPIPRTSIIVNKPFGLVSVVGAKISHFSKYGWVRKHNPGN